MGMQSLYSHVCTVEEDWWLGLQLSSALLDRYVFGIPRTG